VVGRNELGWGPYSDESTILKAQDAIRAREVTPWAMNLEWNCHPTARIFAFELQVRAH
jgi:hypothetical protein